MVGGYDGNWNWRAKQTSPASVGIRRSKISLVSNLEVKIDGAIGLLTSV